MGFAVGAALLAACREFVPLPVVVTSAGVFDMEVMAQDANKGAILLELAERLHIRTDEILAIGEGITTREQATLRLNGGQRAANVDPLARDNEQLRAAQGQVDQSTTDSGTISAALREALVAEAIKSIKEGDKHENA